MPLHHSGLIKRQKALLPHPLALVVAAETQQWAWVNTRRNARLGYFDSSAHIAVDSELSTIAASWVSLSSATQGMADYVALQAV